MGSQGTSCSHPPKPRGHRCGTSDRFRVNRGHIACRCSPAAASHPRVSHRHSLAPGSRGGGSVTDVTQTAVLLNGHRVVMAAGPQRMRNSVRNLGPKPLSVPKFCSPSPSGPCNVGTEAPGTVCRPVTPHHCHDSWTLSAAGGGVLTTLRRVATGFRARGPGSKPLPLTRVGGRGGKQLGLQILGWNEVKAPDLRSGNGRRRVARLLAFRSLSLSERAPWKWPFLNRQLEGRAAHTRLNSGPCCQVGQHHAYSLDKQP